MTSQDAQSAVVLCEEVSTPPGAAWDDGVRKMDEALVPLGEDDDGKHAQFLREGLLTLVPKSREGRRKLMEEIRGHSLEDNIICSSVAVNAAATYLFFKQFAKFTGSLIRMPTADMQADQKIMVDQVCEAYNGAVEYSLKFAEAMQKLGNVPNYLEQTKALAEIRVKAMRSKKLTQDKVEQSTHMNEIIEALMVLEKGADAQIQRAMGILNAAVQQSATATQWDQLLKDEQTARACMDEACKRLGELIRSIELNKLERRQSHLKLLLAENQKKKVDKSKELRQMKLAHEQFVQTVKSNQAEAFRTAVKNWEDQKVQAVASAQKHVTHSEELVQKGGHKVGTKTTQSGWWLWASETSEDIYDVETAKKTMESAQEQLRKVNEQYEESNRPKMGEDMGQRAERSFDHQEREIAGLESKRETLQKEMDDCGSRADEIRESQRQAQEEVTVKTAAWTVSKKKLEKAMEVDDLSEGMTSQIIKSYRSGLDMHQAMQLTGFLAKGSLFNLSDFGKAFAAQCEMLSECDTADDQIEVIDYMRENLVFVPEAQGPRQLTADASIAIVFCKHVASGYVPLPSFEQISKGDVVTGYDMALQVHDAAAAADAALLDQA